MDSLHLLGSVFGDGLDDLLAVVNDGLQGSLLVSAYVATLAFLISTVDWNVSY